MLNEASNPKPTRKLKVQETEKEKPLFGMNRTNLLFMKMIHQ
jgi:hypothetical protein